MQVKAGTPLVSMDTNVNNKSIKEKKGISPQLNQQILITGTLECNYYGLF
jgi:hypothetical protein